MVDGFIANLTVKQIVPRSQISFYSSFVSQLVQSSYSRYKARHEGKQIANSASKNRLSGGLCLPPHQNFWCGGLNRGNRDFSGCIISSPLASLQFQRAGDHLNFKPSFVFVATMTVLKLIDRKCRNSVIARNHRSLDPLPLKRYRNMVCHAVPHACGHL